MAPPQPSADSVVLTGYQKLIVGILAFLQFTIVLDFIMLSPLGALLMAELEIPAARFGLVVSVYAFSAGASGLLAAGFADRFDRKKLLLFFYVGFVLGTLFCALAPSYHFLLAARMVTGLFGGVVGSISFAIIADLFPPQARGRVMGVVQTSFAASQVAGVPIALVLANRWGWHAPFYLLVVISSAVGVLIALRMQPIVGHLTMERSYHPFRHLLASFSRGSYLRAYASMMMLVTGGFMLMPFGSAYIVNNMGISMHQLPIIYMVTGAFSIVAGPLIGRLSDSIGKYVVFCAGSTLSAALVLVFTNLGITPLWLAVIVNVLLMMGISARMIAASALTSVVPDAPDRGAFMAVSSSIQQIAGGVASAVAGLIVIRAPSGALQNYDTLGYVVASSMVIVVGLLYTIHRDVAAKTADAPANARSTA